MVGGVGIMNIMLVSVTERTREIGLRMAVGAGRSDILWQFITEAVMFCMFGGMIGIVLGRGGSMLRPQIPALADSDFRALPSCRPSSSRVTVGLVFGFYPAWKASRSIRSTPCVTSRRCSRSRGLAKQAQ